MNSRRVPLVALLALCAGTAALANCADDDNPPAESGVDAGGIDATADARADVTLPPGQDAGTDVSVTDAAVVDVAVDAPVDAPADVSADAPDDAGDAGDAGADADADAGPQFDDAGCPLPTGVVVNAADAGVPSTGLVLWLRGDVGVATLNNVTDGGSVCRWDDVSGSGHPFFPATPATPPLKTESGLDGSPAVSFPASGRALVRSDLLGIPATSGRTVAVYGKAADTTHRFQYFIQGQSATSGTYFGLDQNTFNTVGSREGVYVTNNAYDTTLATSTSARTHILSIDTFVAGTALPAPVTYAIDGTTLTLTRTSGGLGNNTIESFASANFTALGAAVAGFTGAVIGEMLVYDRALTALERTAIEQYFQNRF